MIFNRKMIYTFLISFSFFCSICTFLYGCDKNTTPSEPEIIIQDEQEVNVLDFRHAASSDHEMIQRAIDYASQRNIKTVWVPKGNYFIDAAGVGGERGILLRSGLTLKMHDEAVLQALPNDVPNYSVVRVYDVEDVKIVGGTILGEKNEHTGKGGEWGMGIDIQSSRNVKITNTIIKDCWGDGIYIGGNRKSSNVFIDNVVCEANRRQGISIVYADNVIVKNSILSKTRGTAPQAGIDVEPNTGQYVSNVKVFNTKFLNNTGPGLFVFAGTGKVSGIIVENCLSEGNSHAGINLNGGNKVLPIKGLTNVRISNVVLKNNPLIGLSVKEVDNLIVDTIQVTDSKQRAVRIRFSKNVALDSIVVQDVITDAFSIEGSEHVVTKRVRAQGLSSTSIGWRIETSTHVNILASALYGGAIGIEGKDVHQLTVHNVLLQGHAEQGVSFVNVSNSTITKNRFENIGKIPVYLAQSNNNTFKGNLLKANSFNVNNQFSQITVTNKSVGNSILENIAFNSSKSNKARHVIRFENTTLNNISKDNVFEAGSFAATAVQDDTNGLNQVN